MKKNLLITWCTIYYCFALGMSSERPPQDATAIFFNKFKVPLSIAINGGQPISLDPNEKIGFTLSNNNPDFIKTITFDKKCYNKSNLAIAEWNWKIAQAAGCSRLSAYRYAQDPTFLIDDITFDLLDFADEISAIGLGSAQKNGKVQVNDEQEIQFTTAQGRQRKIKIYKPNDKKIIRFFNRSTDPLTIGINRKKQKTLEVCDKPYELKVEDNFEVEKVTINGNVFTVDDLMVQEFNTIVQRVFPGHFCDIELITDDFLKKWLQQEKIIFTNFTNQELTVVINDLLPFVLGAHKKLKQAGAEAEKRPNEQRSISSGMRLLRGRSASSPSVIPTTESHAITLRSKNSSNNYIETLVINGNRYTTENTGIQNLNSLITNALECLGQKHSTIEVGDDFLTILKNNQEKLNARLSILSNQASSSSNYQARATQELSMRPRTPSPLGDITLRRLRKPSGGSSSEEAK